VKVFVTPLKLNIGGTVPEVPYTIGPQTPLYVSVHLGIISKLFGPKPMYV